MRRLKDEEEGAIAVIVGILLVVMVGFAAIAVDVSALYSERRQLQNGADAAALALVQACMDDGVPCGGVDAIKDDIAKTYSDANANDGFAEADVDFEPNDCRAEVITSTLDEEGGTLLPPTFARVLVEDYDGTTVTARAVAVCGGIAAGGGVPLTFSENAWENVEKVQKPDGAPSDWWETWAPGDDVTDNVFFHQEEDFGAGAFGWLKLDDDETCYATIDELGQVVGDPGNNFLCTGFENGTKKNAEAFENYILSNNPHLVPIYESYSGGGGGGNLQYKISGFAVIYITGWNFSGEHYEHNAPCSGNERCLSGHFLESISLGDQPAGGSNFGVFTYSLVE